MAARVKSLPAGLGVKAPRWLGSPRSTLSAGRRVPSHGALRVDRRLSRWSFRVLLTWSATLEHVEEYPASRQRAHGRSLSHIARCVEQLVHDVFSGKSSQKTKRFMQFLHGRAGSHFFRTLAQLTHRIPCAALFSGAAPAGPPAPGMAMRGSLVVPLTPLTYASVRRRNH